MGSDKQDPYLFLSRFSALADVTVLRAFPASVLACPYPQIHNTEMKDLAKKAKKTKLKFNADLLARISKVRLNTILPRRTVVSAPSPGAGPPSNNSTQPLIGPGSENYCYKCNDQCFSRLSQSSTCTKLPSSNESTQPLIGPGSEDYCYKCNDQCFSRLSQSSNCTKLPSSTPTQPIISTLPNSPVKFQDLLNTMPVHCRTGFVVASNAAFPGGKIATDLARKRTKAIEKDQYKSQEESITAWWLNLAKTQHSACSYADLFHAQLGNQFTHSQSYKLNTTATTTTQNRPWGLIHNRNTRSVLTYQQVDFTTSYDPGHYDFSYILDITPYCGRSVHLAYVYGPCVADSGTSKKKNSNAQRIRLIGYDHATHYLTFFRPTIKNAIHSALRKLDTAGVQMALIPPLSGVANSLSIKAINLEYNTIVSEIIASHQFSFIEEIYIPKAM